MAEGKHTCIRCGATYGTGAAAGLCPRCLLRRALGGAVKRIEEPMPVSRPELPRRFGEYELVEVIARGGMGVVYAARQPGLGRIIAIKLLLSGTWASPEYVERFRNEARAAASLDHPNIVPVYGFGECEGHWYLAMKRIEGSSLAETLQRWGRAGEPVAYAHPEVAAQLILGLANAVHYAHQRGVLHRDLKPGNVLVDEQGQPHLTDFGLARLDDAEVRLTQTRGMLGTPSYMAPEQAGAGNGTVTTATDVYALGAILYELLAGKPPFTAPDTISVLRMVAEEDPVPPWIVRAQKLQEQPTKAASARLKDLALIALKCLEKSPARRYGSAEALAQDLARWLRGETPTVRPPTLLERSRKWVRKNPVQSAVSAVATLAILVVTVLSVYWNLRLTAARQRIAIQAEAQRKELVRLNLATGNRLAESGDPFAGLLWLAEAARLDSGFARRGFVHSLRFDLTTRSGPRLDGLLSLTSRVECAAFDARNHLIGIGTADGWMRVVDVQSSREMMRIRPNGPVAAASFSPNGQQIVTRGFDGVIQAWSMESGEPVGETIRGAAPLRGRDGLETPVAYDPTGRRVVTLGRTTVRIRSAASWKQEGEPLPIPNAWHASFSPDGTRLAVASKAGRVGIWSVEQRTLEVEGPDGLGWRWVAWSPDGRHLAATDVAFRAVVFSSDDGQLESPWLTAGDMLFAATFSPDSRRLLLLGYDNAARIVEGPAWKQPGWVLRHEGPVRTGGWSSDGRLVVTGGLDGTVRVWDVETGNALPGIIRHGGALVHVEFRQEDQGLLTVGREGLVRLWQRPDRSGAVHEFKNGSPVDTVAWSPDGRRLVAVALDPLLRIWDLQNPEAPPQILQHPARPFMAAFLEDGRTLLSLGSDETMRWWDLNSGRMIRERKPEGGREGWHYARFSPDARRLLLARHNRWAEVRDTSDGKLLAELEGSDGSWGLLQPSTDGTRCTASNGKEIALWDFATGKRVGGSLPLGDAAGAWLVVANPTFDRYATTSGEFFGRLMDRQGRIIGSPLRHVSTLNDAQFSPDGRLLVTASNDSALRVWEAATGDPLGPPLRHPTRVLRAVFSPDGRFVATAASDGIARVWDLGCQERSADSMLREAWRLSGHTLDFLGGLSPLPATAIRPGR